MRFFRSVVLYAGLALGANAAFGATGAVEALREGMMKKLEFSPVPVAVPEVVFTDAGGGEHSLAEYRGKYVLVNFWATWCAPCRAEMPSLDRLQTALGGADFQVVTIATGRNSLAGINRFFRATNVTALPILLDPKQVLAREMGVLGLPLSVILNRQGLEIARLQGDADWDSESAMAIFRALLAGD